MKIGFVLDDSLDPADGVQQYVLTLGYWFRENGHEVHYLVGHTERDDIPNIHNLSRTLSVRANSNRMATPLPARTKKIERLLSRNKFNVLHVQMPYSPFLAAKVINQAPDHTAVIGTFHVMPYSLRETLATKALAAVLYKNIKRFDRVLSVSKPAAEFAKKAFNVDSEILPNVVDVGRFKKGKKLAKYNDGFTNIVFLGRLVRRKGCMHLLEAISHLSNNYTTKNIRVIICGKGPQRAILQQFVRDNKLENIVEFVGFVPEKQKPDYLATADVVVLPSTGGESFGIVVVEAMSAGADVIIAGDNPGYRSVLNDAEKQLVNPRDIPAFANTIRHFIEDVQARKSARNWQSQQAVQYDVKVIGPKLLKIYQEELNKRKAMKN